MINIHKFFFFVRNNIPSIFLLSLIILYFLFLFLNPYEEYLGGRDPGTYINTSQLTFRSDDLEIYPLDLLDEEFVKDAFHFENRPASVGHIGYYMLGYYIDNQSYLPQSIKLSTQFLKIPTQVGAIFISLFGYWNIIYLPIVLVLAISLLYFFLLKKYFSNNTILVSIIIWLSLPTQLFWSRSFNSEFFVVLFVLLSLISVKYIKSELLAAISSTFFMLLAVLSRADAIVFYPAVIGLISIINNYKQLTILLIFQFIISTLAIMLPILQSYPYYGPHFVGMIQPLGVSLQDFYNYRFIIPLIFSSIIFLSSILFFTFYRFIMSNFKIVEEYLLSFSKLKFILLSLTTVALVTIYTIGTRISLISDWTNIYKLSWYLGGLPGMLLVFLAILSILIDKLHSIFKTKRAFFPYFLLICQLTLLALLLYSAKISLDHPWWSRRFITSILMLYPLSVTYFLSQASIRSIYKATILILIVVQNFIWGYPILTTKQFPGSKVYVEKIESCLQNNSNVFFTNYNPNDPAVRSKHLTSYFFSLPIWTVYNHNVVYPSTTDLNNISRMLENMLIKTGNVDVINPPNEILESDSDLLNFRKTCEFSFQSEMLGWKSLIDPKQHLKDLALTEYSPTFIDVPISVYQVTLSY